MMNHIRRTLLDVFFARTYVSRRLPSISEPVGESNFERASDFTQKPLALESIPRGSGVSLVSCEVNTDRPFRSGAPNSHTRKLAFIRSLLYCNSDAAPM